MFISKCLLLVSLFLVLEKEYVKKYVKKYVKPRLKLIYIDGNGYKDNISYGKLVPGN